MPLLMCEKVCVTGSGEARLAPLAFQRLRARRLPKQLCRWHTARQPRERWAPPLSHKAQARAGGAAPREALSRRRAAGEGSSRPTRTDMPCPLSYALLPLICLACHIYIYIFIYPWPFGLQAMLA